jgi:catechol-2,3-dioxygenase
MTRFNIEFSHIGLQVFDIERMIGFYSGVLGFPVTDRGLLHGTVPIAFLSRDPRDHHQIALVQMRPEEAKLSTVNQISFRLPDVETLRAMRDHLRRAGYDQFRMAMHGNALSLYVFDPEGNQLEIFVDTPWYIPQPCSLPYDLDLPTDEILAKTEQFCRAQPGFKPAQDWQAEFTRVLAANVGD